MVDRRPSQLIDMRAIAGLPQGTIEKASGNRQHDFDYLIGKGVAAQVGRMGGFWQRVHSDTKAYITNPNKGPVEVILIWGNQINVINDGEITQQEDIVRGIRISTVRRNMLSRITGVRIGFIGDQDLDSTAIGNLPSDVIVRKPEETLSAIAKLLTAGRKKDIARRTISPIGSDPLALETRMQIPLQLSR